MKKSIFYCSYVYRYKTEVEQGKKLLPYVEQAVKYTKADGLDAIELLPTGALTADDTSYAQKLRELMDKEKIKCACFSFGTPMLRDPSNALEVLKKYVDIAKILGSPFLHHTFQSSYEKDKQPHLQSVYASVENIFADIAREVAYYAGERDMQCIYEDQGYYVNTTDRLSRLINKISLPNTGVCLDVGNSLYYDIPAEYYAGVFASKIKHVHLKDYLICNEALCPAEKWEYSISGQRLVPCLPGTGNVNFEKIFSILQAAGYDGYYSLEHQGNRPDYSNELADSMISKSLDNIEHIYNRIKR